MSRTLRGWIFLNVNYVLNLPSMVRLLFLINQKNFDALKDIFYSTKDNTEKALELIKMYSAENSTEAFLNIDNLDSAGHRAH